MRALGRFGRDTAGASAVEFAIVAVPLLLLLIGTIEFGRLLWTQQAMQSLATSTARCIGIRQSECATGGTYNTALTTAHVLAEARKLSVPLTAANLTLSSSTTCNGVSGFSKVTINYTFVSAVPDFLMELAAGKGLAATACFPNQV